ncbi:MAG: glycerol-3-phosphate 1-O-acyltransferase PlsY [Alphaproteobacteria bacterium]|nr:glycerol-3-phosphate 1-O-acyltransferase PlsY [Alphaproteobacteria bacterium]MCW5744066.1 glycerol-3-phosphate 1-O-acyltransferase PlsY [Alphaproteobacteria bacterium]
MIASFLTIDTLIGLALGYLLGSIPFGLLLTRAAGLGDIRSIGSGNIGATNVLRTGNKAVAAATLLLDALKGAVAVIVAGLVLGPIAALTAGLGAVLGHCFPAWLNFKGGKGVATTLGSLLALSWPFGIAACLLWLLYAVLFRISSLSALLGLATTTLLAWLAAATSFSLFGRFLSSTPFAIAVTLIVALVVAMHHENIGRLLAGTEPRIGAKK